MKIRRIIEQEIFEIGAQLKGLGFLLQCHSPDGHSAEDRDRMYGVGLLADQAAKRLWRLSSTFERLEADDFDVEINEDRFDPIGPVVKLIKERSSSLQPGN